MNLMTPNTLGIGENKKDEWVCKLWRNQSLVLMALQETQMGDLQNSLNIARCWGNENYGFELVNATGRSGGLLTICDPCFFDITDTIVSRYFLAIFGTCPVVGALIVIVNVYGPKKVSGKTKLWNDLLNLKHAKQAT